MSVSSLSAYASSVIYLEQNFFSYIIPMVISILFHRTTELIEGALSPFVMAAAFFSAMLGGIMAPIITEGFRAIASMDVPSIELPRIRRKDDKYYYQGNIQDSITNKLNLKKKR